MAEHESAKRLVGELLNTDPLAHIKEFGEPNYFNREAQREVGSIIGGRLLLDENGLTAGMNRCVVEPIFKALDDFRDLYNKASHEVKSTHDEISQGLNYETEKEKISESARGDKHSVEQNKMGSDSFKRVEDEYASAAKRYTLMKDENGGRDPGKFPLALYIFGLFLIGLAEWFINYSTFRDTYVPLVAGASTFLIACIFASASHWHGIFFKQNVRLFHRTRPASDRISDLIWLIFATTALLAVFLYIGWMRYNYIGDQMGGVDFGSVDLLSEETSGMDPVLSKTLQTIGLNAFVWCVGIFVSYFFHDAVPGFKEASNLYVKLQRKRDSIAQSMKQDLEVSEEIKSQNMQALEGRVSAQTERLREIRDLEKKVEVKFHSILSRADNDIKSSLKRYKDHLSTHLLEQSSEEIAIGVDRISIDQFIAQESAVPISKLEQRMKPTRNQ